MSIKPVLIQLAKVLAGSIIMLALLATCSQTGYAGDLSKSKSVTPERYSGFFVPQALPASQAGYVSGARVHSHTNRLQSVYDGMTSQNKPATVNMWGGTFAPRVNPVTLMFRAASQNSKAKGGSHA